MAAVLTGEGRPAHGETNFAGGRQPAELGALVPDQGAQGPTTQNPPDNTQQRVESATDNTQNPPR